MSELEKKDPEELARALWPEPEEEEAGEGSVDAEESPDPVESPHPEESPDPGETSHPEESPDPGETSPPVAPTTSAEAGGESEVLAAGEEWGQPGGVVSAAGFEELAPAGGSEEEEEFEFDLDGISLDEPVEKLVEKKPKKKGDPKKKWARLTGGKEPSALARVMQRVGRIKKSRRPRRAESGPGPARRLEPRTLLMAVALLVVPLVALATIGLPGDGDRGHELPPGPAAELLWADEYAPSAATGPERGPLGFVAAISADADRDLDYTRALGRLQSYLAARRACLESEGAARNRALLREYLICRRSIEEPGNPEALEQDLALIEERGGGASLVRSLGEGKGFRSRLEACLVSPEARALVLFLRRARREGDAGFPDLLAFLDVAEEGTGPGSPSRFATCRVLGGPRTLEENLFLWFPREEKVLAQVLIHVYGRRAGRPREFLFAAREEAIGAVERFLWAVLIRQGEPSFLGEAETAARFREALAELGRTRAAGTSAEFWSRLQAVLGRRGEGFSSLASFLFHHACDRRRAGSGVATREILADRRRRAAGWLELLGLSPGGKGAVADLAARFDREVEKRLAAIDEKPASFDQGSADLVDYIEGSLGVEAHRKVEAYIELAGLARKLGRKGEEADFYAAAMRVQAADTVDPLEGLTKLKRIGESLIEKAGGKPAAYRRARAFLAQVLLKQGMIEDRIQRQSLAAEASFLIADSYIREARARRVEK